MMTPSPITSQAAPRVNASELAISLRSLPYLADHALQDAIVLPGSFYIDVALRMMADVGSLVRVHRVTFRSPVILTELDRLLKQQVTDVSDGLRSFRFYEAHAADSTGRPAADQFVASLDIEDGPPTSATAESIAFSPDAFRARPHTFIDSERFYRTLRAAGNQYGPRFRNVAAVWRSGDECLGEIRVPRQDAGTTQHVHPALLDSVIQVLAGFVIGHGKTFVLQSIDRIEVPGVSRPETLWVHATRLSGGERHDSGIAGNVRAFDEEGRTYIELFGVAFSFLGSVEAPAHPPLDLRIAANFTAEPVEDSLTFWGDYFGVRTRIEFAPYNQVYQQLLDRASTFSTSSVGFNIVLLELERWASLDGAGTVILNQDRTKRAFGDRARYRLPNGLEIVDLNRYETDYVYKEVFQDECYLRHGISLHDGDTVVDVGANIGLFSLFVMSRCRDARILAFEPSAAVYPLLRANCEAYGDGAHVFNVGVSSERGSAPFTFYEKSSVFSGFHADESDDRQAIAAVMHNMVADGRSTDDPTLVKLVDQLTADRLRSTTYECPLTSVSDIIADNQLDRIHLLKIDAEKSELAILRGIQERDWDKIDQLVIEIHGQRGDEVTEVEQLLRDKGYRCAKEQERLLERSGLFTVYAIREDMRAATPGAHGALARETNRSQALTGRVDEFCDALELLMERTPAPMILALCPHRPGTDAEPVLRDALEHAERRLLTRAARIRHVQTISSQAALRHYPVRDYYDPDASQLGQIPYTTAGYAAIGTSVFRTVFNRTGETHKVIVLDCDNTLWEGACGEDGVNGIRLTKPYCMLQTFIREQVRTGMLLCLCSKNNEADVMEVFDQRSDMVLKREHIVAHRINWESKSANIRSLAAELSVSLDSIIFLDDNPVECAEVRINCPSVLTLQLPPNAEALASFLDHIWPFDHASVTQEDYSRTRMYQENTQRQALASQVSSLNDFIRALELRVQIREPMAEELGRVSQLTLRTNQFNFTTKRRSEGEVQAFLDRANNAGCLIVHASDRFGDYGLIGVVLYDNHPDRYIVDTFLLSCRILGKGVEHRVMAALGSKSRAEGKAFVELRYSPTAKNVPAWDFLRTISRRVPMEAAIAKAEGPRSAFEGGARRSGEWTLPVESLARLEYNADEHALASQHDGSHTVHSDGPPAQVPFDFARVSLSDRFQRIGEHLSDASQLVAAIHEHRVARTTRSVTTTDTLPRNALEAAIADIWKRVLHTAHVGLHENFFDAGGTSLAAVQVIASINRELKTNLSMVSLFECPTITLLAASLSASPATVGGSPTVDDAALRGLQRRRKAITRRSS